MPARSSSCLALGFFLLGLVVASSAFAEVVAFPPGDVGNCQGGRGVLTWNGNLATNDANNVKCRGIPNVGATQVLVSDGNSFSAANRGVLKMSGRREKKGACYSAMLLDESKTVGYQRKGYEL